MFDFIAGAMTMFLVLAVVGMCVTGKRGTETEERQTVAKRRVK